MIWRTITQSQPCPMCYDTALCRIVHRLLQLVYSCLLVAIGFNRKALART